MTLASMTGFARATGIVGPWHCAWEVRSVNAKGLDLRLRLAPPFDPIEAEAREKIAAKNARGTVHATLNADREAMVRGVRINQVLLRELAAVVSQIPLPETVAPLTLDGLLSICGMVEITDAADDEAAGEKGRPAGAQSCCFTVYSRSCSSSSPLTIWPRISPAGNLTVWILP